MKSRVFRLFPILFFGVVISLFGCTKNDKPGGDSDDAATVKKFEKAMMEQYYYWSDQMSVPTNASSYTVYTYFDALLVPKDHWSWMCDGAAYAESETGVSTSYGFHFKQPVNYYEDYDVYIAYVDKQSPLGKAGVTRGWRLDAIKGIPIKTYISNGTLKDEIALPSNNFTFTDLDGESVELNLSQASFKSSTVIGTQVYTNANCSLLNPSTKVGYINYVSFNSNLQNEILDALSEMKSAGVNELILDLRYNGGGDLSLCTSVASLLAPAGADGKTFLHIAHNAKQQSEDFYKKIARTANSFNLNRLYVITTGSTASASESIINGLSPYIDVITVGETTYGKPNGMYLILYPNGAKSYTDVDYAFYPICFYCLNANEKADFENGIKPTHTRYDDPYHNFDTSEDLIYSTLYLIANGSMPPAPSKPGDKSTKLPGESNGVIQTPESAPGYGMATLKTRF